MASYKVIKSRRAAGITLESLQKRLEGASDAEFEGSPTLKSIFELVQRGLAEGSKVLTATGASREQVLEVFGLQLVYDDEGCLEKNHVWDLRGPGEVKDTLWLDYGFHLYQKVFTSTSEATCRTILDLILLDRLAHSPGSSAINFEEYTRRHRERSSSKAALAPTTPTRPSVTPSDHTTPTNCTYPLPYDSSLKSGLPPTTTEPGVTIRAYGEVYMNVKIGDILCTGRADYAIGYGTSEKMLETSFVIIEAKRQAGLIMEKAMTQGLFYLGVVHSERKRAGKINAMVYGVCSDGKEYRFIRIGQNGEVALSSTLLLSIAQQRKRIIAFVHYILECCVKSSPSSTPTKGTKKMKAEVDDYQDVVERPVFRFGSVELGEIEEVDEEWMKEL